MHCIDRVERRFRLGLVSLSVLAGCSGPAPTPQAPGPGAAPAAGVGATAPVGGSTVPAPTAVDGVRLAPPGPVRNRDELRRQAALRIVAANPNGVYSGPVPDPLLAIPVLEVDLNRDGSIRRIEVLRRPRQALDTVKLATDAVRRAAPFGDVSLLPRPWRFTETFLFNDDRKFKPRTLDE
ncbi:MAG: hypothetical protein ABIP61_13930 [Burkholderiaceae bacterium]